MTEPIFLLHGALGASDQMEALAAALSGTPHPFERVATPRLMAALEGFFPEID